MDNIYINNKDKIKKALKVIWNYMKLNQTLEKCDLIIGCGCANLDIPARCAELFNQGYASKILFAGGKGKITENSFTKSEAEIYRDIAIKNGVDKDKILVETKSTNTGDNFKFALDILNQNNIKFDKVLIVHHPFNERRTLSTAKEVLKNKSLIITSFDITFEDYIYELGNKSFEDIMNEISVIVGDIQRLIIYPQFGWLTKNDVPNEVIDAYNFLKELGFSKYILSYEQIKKLINQFGIISGEEENYFV